ncbi:MAG: HpcH/HpaI aldolase family protein [Acidimicrobiales bacterium]
MEHFLRESWRSGQPALGLWCTVGNTLVAEALASVEPDYVCVDMQHGSSYEGNLVGMLQAVEAGGSSPVVRVPENNPASIMKALDAGARGVIVPLVESGEQAARAVEACRFPPYGSRSFGPFRASIHARTSDPRELEKVACVVMVETRAGIDHLDEIVETDGLTAVYVGPSDLSIALGLAPGSVEDPGFVAVLEEIRAACAAHDVVPGLHCYDGRTARRAVEQGFGMVTVAVELRALRAALGVELAEARSAVLPAAATSAATQVTGTVA